MGVTENESDSSQNRGNEKFALFMVEMFCMMGSMASIMYGITYSVSIPNALQIGFSVAFLLFGFIFERGLINAQLPSRLRESIWWIGSIFILMVFVIRPLITGSLTSWTIDDIQLLGFLLVFWLVGAGLKRLLVRGRFEQAYRGMVAKAGEHKFHINRRLVIGAVGFIAIIDLFALIFDNENFPRILASSVIFIFFISLCVGGIIDNSRTKNTNISEFDKYALQ